MAFFLSKLLPLFVYPLGISCILLAIAALRLRRNSVKFKRQIRILVTAAFLILYLSSNRFISDILVRSLEGQNIPQAELPKTEAIVVLGGGTKSQIAPRPWIEVGEAGDRILYGAKLYRDQKAPWLVLSGGRVSWRVDGGDSPESSDMAVLAGVMGVPSQAILEDQTSLNTRENAINVQKILTEKKLNSILLVTSALHMPRSLLIFRKLGIETIAAPTDFLVVNDRNSLEFAEILLKLLPDPSALNNTTNALKEYLGILVAQF